MTFDAAQWESRMGLALGSLQPLGDQLAALPGDSSVVHGLERLFEQAMAVNPDSRWLEDADGQRALARIAYAAPFLLRPLGLDSGQLAKGLLLELSKPAELIPWRKFAEVGCPSNLPEPEFARVLRRWKYANYVRVTAQDLMGYSDTAATCLLISDLAQQMVRLNLVYAFCQLARRQGLPLNDQGQLVHFFALGMGKLGGRELNYSSDVDLIFVRAEEGAACHSLGEFEAPDYDPAGDEAAYWAAWDDLAGRATIPGARDTGDFYNRVIRQAVRLMELKTPEGQGFRMDLDLRPLGRGGPLVPPVSLASTYYEDQGREWERTALLKARVVAGEPALAESFMESLRPFIYRRYLDYSALEGIAIVKHDIDRQEGTQGQRNVKLGRGGIRENEFFVQALQLIYGGRHAALRVTGHMEALEQLAGHGLLPRNEADAHREAYWLLRAVENRLQMVGEGQTHTLPADSEELMRVLHDFEPAFQERLDSATQGLQRAREETALRFQELSAGLGADQPVDSANWQDQVRAAIPPEQGEGLLERTHALFNHLMTTRMGERCVIKLGRLLQHPRLYEQGTEPGFPRWLEFLEQIGNRNALLALMEAHPPIVSWVQTIFSEGGHFAELLISHPEFLESYFSLADEAAGFQTRFDDILQQARDEEEFILELQSAKSQGVIRVLTEYLANAESSAHSQALTALADAAVNVCIRYAWRVMTARMGPPPGAQSNEVSHFAVLAMGRWGSAEMRMASDLDLVFVHNGQGETAKGRSALEFFTKLGQKITTLLTSQTQFGRLYELDHRLRPFGNKGLLVPSLPAYESFLKEAEVWNFQAFSRLRVIGGDGALGQSLIQAIAAHWRQRALPPALVAARVWSMLQRLVSEHGRNGLGEKDLLPLKYATGGMLGFEFLDQYEFLKSVQSSAAGWTHKAPHGIIAELNGHYRTLSALDERLSLYKSPFAHGVSPADFERYAALASRWEYDAIREQARQLGSRVEQAFSEASRGAPSSEEL